MSVSRNYRGELKIFHSIQFYLGRLFGVKMRELSINFLQLNLVSMFLGISSELPLRLGLTISA